MKLRIGILLSLIFIISTADAADNPHTNIKFDCVTCHSVDSFEDMSFDHKLTGYELENRHKSADCRGCHDIADFSIVKKNCIGCHQDIHQNKMGSDCESCHTTRGWEQFDIQKMHINTNFPISGRHALVDCQSCHKGMPSGDFALNTTRCVECHQTEYLTTISPEHVNNGFSTECESCHQMDRWKPALLENHEMFFPIYSGTHNKKWDDCATCHIDPNSYQNFSCLNCHEHIQPETDSDHNGISGYAYNSPDCYFCHPTGEAGDFGDHDAQYFPIFSGRHNNEWDDCSICHTNPADRKDFNCLQCHTHNQTDTDNIHGSMTGYAYNSSDCYLCHPTGEAGDFTAHDAQYFPIFSGSHNNEWSECTECHAVPEDRTQYTCLVCHDHNQTDMNNMHGTMTGYEYLTTACYSCHPSGEKGTFTGHDLQFFPIFSGVHNSRWENCVDCHPVTMDRTVFSCFQCHSQNDMDDKHLGEVNGYAYDSDLCLSCHPTGRAED